MLLAIPPAGSCKGGGGQKQEKGQEDRSQGSSSQVVLTALVVRIAGFPWGKFSPLNVPLPIVDLTSSGSLAGPRPPTDRDSKLIP